MAEDNKGGMLDTVASGVGTAANTVGSAVTTAAGTMADLAKRAVNVLPGGGRSAVVARRKSGAREAKTARPLRRRRRIRAEEDDRRQTAAPPDEVGARPAGSAARSRPRAARSGRRSAGSSSTSRSLARQRPARDRAPQEVATRRGETVYRRSRRLPFRSGPFPLRRPSSPGARRGVRPPEQAGPPERPLPEALLDQVARAVLRRGRAARTAASAPLRPAPRRRSRAGAPAAARAPPGRGARPSRTARRRSRSARPACCARVDGPEVLVAVLQGDRARAHAVLRAAGAPPRRTAPGASRRSALEVARCPRRRCAPGRCSWRRRASRHHRAVVDRRGRGCSRSWPCVPSRRSSRAGSQRGEVADGVRRPSLQQRPPPSSAPRPTAAARAAGPGTRPPCPAAPPPGRPACACRRRSWPPASSAATPTEAVSCGPLADGRP